MFSSDINCFDNKEELKAIIEKGHIVQVNVVHEKDKGRIYKIEVRELGDYIVAGGDCTTEDLVEVKDDLHNRIQSKMKDKPWEGK